MKTTALFLIFAGLFLYGNNKIFAEDYEVWTFVGAETEWKNVEFSLTSANFFVPEGGWFLNFTQVSFDFISKNNFSLGLAYKQEYVKFPNQMRTESRPMVHLFYNKEWGNFEFRDRNRLEFRIIEGKLINRYRNQLLLSYNKLKYLTPYISTELFFYFNPVNYVRQRTALGLNVPIKSVNLNLFAGHQINEGLPTIWLKKYILGTSLSYSF